jgi:hypothetical protein
VTEDDEPARFVRLPEMDKSRTVRRAHRRHAAS